MKLYPKIDKEQRTYLMDLILKKNKISLRRATQLILEVIEILAHSPEFLNFDPLIEALEEQSGLPYQQNLICLMEKNEIRSIIIIRSVKGSKSPKIFSFPLEFIPNQIPKKDFQKKIESRVGRISQIVIIKEKAINLMVNNLNKPKGHQILDVIYTFSNEVKSNRIIISPMILPEDFLYLNFQDVLLKFGELIGFKTRKSERIFTIPLKIIKIFAHALKMGVFTKLLKQLKRFNSI